MDKNAHGSGLTINKDLGAAVCWRDMGSHRTAASRGSMRERRPPNESLARGSPAGGAGKALGVAGISMDRSQNGEREGVTLPEAIRRLPASIWRRPDRAKKIALVNALRFKRNRRVAIPWFWRTGLCSPDKHQEHKISSSSR
jgi:hypothetical protein